MRDEGILMTMTQPGSEKQPAKQAGTQSSPEAPPLRRNWAASVAQDAGPLAGAAFARAGFADPSLVLRWTEIAGAAVARIARPVRFSQKDGVLTLLAEPGAALFLGHESRVLTARINAWAGRQLVSRIKFVQGRLSASPSLSPPPRPARNLNPSDPSNSYEGPERLKAALQSLARWRVRNPSHNA
jgi:hypothetical protein